MEVSQDTLQSQLQSSSTVILDCDYGTHHIRDSEWELL